MSNVPAIVFVCTGNTCRSFMAEYVFKELWLKQGKSAAAVQVLSRGTGVRGNGGGPNPSALVALESWGLDEGLLADARRHTPTLLAPDTVPKGEALYICMTEEKRRELHSMLPSVSEDCSRLLVVDKGLHTEIELEGGGGTVEILKEGDVIDPYVYGGLPEGPQVYKATLDAMQSVIVELAESPRLAGAGGEGVKESPSKKPKTGE